MTLMKTLLAGIALIVVLGIGGLVYRNAVEHPSRPGVCPLDAKVCPDGTSVARTGSACDFAACPAPNVALADTGLSFALPAGYVADEHAAGADPTLLGAFVKPSADAPNTTLIIYRYPIPASSTALQVIQSTAIADPSGEPVAPTAFSSITLGSHHFSVVAIGRFEGVVRRAYYLARANDVLRFDAVDMHVENWTDPGLDTSALPANQDLRALLTTLQGE